MVPSHVIFYFSSPSLFVACSQMAKKVLAGNSLTGQVDEEKGGAGARGRERGRAERPGS